MTKFKNGTPSSFNSGIKTRIEEVLKFKSQHSK